MEDFPIIHAFADFARLPRESGASIEDAPRTMPRGVGEFSIGSRIIQTATCDESIRH